MNDFVQDKAKEIERQYLREWRRKNPDKVKKQRENYWRRKAEKALAEEAKTDGN